jgi:hypothetical protein
LARRKTYGAIVDSDLTVRGIAQDFAALLGWTADDMVGRTALEFVSHPPTDPLELDEWITTTRRELTEAGTLTRISVLTCRNGARPEMLTTTTRANGDGLYIVTGELVTTRAARPSWLTKGEAAQYARCSEKTIERATAEVKLRAGGHRGLRLYRRKWLDAWLAGEEA